jgi:glutamate-1-semialdehyde aminotransferase
VLSCGYHGWHDWYIGSTSRSGGVVDEVARLTSSFKYNDLDDVARRLNGDTACVILEPVAFELPQPGFLEGLRELCTERGVVLVFDEMWTGFRAAVGGAQQLFGVTPDLATFSKAVANGMPLSVLAGHSDIMTLADEDIFFYTTFGGETLSLAAAKATIRELQEHDVPAHLARLGTRLREGVDRLIHQHSLEGLRCAGLPCRMALNWTEPAEADPLLVKSFIQQELVRRGVLWAGFHALSFSHSDADIDYLISAYDDVFPLLRKHLRGRTLPGALRGKPVQPVFLPVAPKEPPRGTAAAYPPSRPTVG